MGKEEATKLRVELPPLIKTKEGYNYFTLILYIRGDRPGIFTEVIDNVRKKVERANIRWSLGNSQMRGRAIVILVFEVPEEDTEAFKETIDEIKKFDYVEKFILDENPHDLGIYAPKDVGLVFDFNGSRTVIISVDFLNSMVDAIGQGGDPVITSLVNTTLYRTSYYRGFSMAEDLKSSLLIDGIGLVEAVLREFKSLGYFGDFSVNKVDDVIEIEFDDLALAAVQKIENPLVLGTIAGILDSAFGAEFKVEVDAFKKIGSESYYAKLICKPVEELEGEPPEAEEKKKERRRFFLYRR